VHSFAANRGKGHALLAGFERLREFDAVVTLDADGQHPPACLPAFVAAAEAGADLVLGRREITPDMPPARRFANRFSSSWCTALAGQPIHDSQCGYRLYRREVLLRTPVRASRYEVETEMAVRAARLGFRIAHATSPPCTGTRRAT
jgi:glycosyltransferase involved in cell wall biosynthesis